jgi:hypothetical protein
LSAGGSDWLKLLRRSRRLTDLSEPEERHEIGEYIDYDKYDCRGYFGDVRIDEAWHSIWCFGSASEAARFMDSCGGILFDEAAQARFTERRWL